MFVFGTVVLVLLLTSLMAALMYKSQGDRTQSPRRPGEGLSFRRIIRRDRIVRAITGPFLAAAALYLTFDLMRLPKLRPFSMVMAGLTVVVVPLFLSRILFYRRMFGRGRKVAGSVTRLSIFDAWTGPTSTDIGNITSKNIKCRIEYSYSFQDRVYSGKSIVAGGDDQAHSIDMMDSAQLQPGDEISLLVDPKNPERSILRDLFASGSTVLSKRRDEK